MAELINWFSNHTLIEIDRCSPLELLKLQENLKRTTERDGIRFVYGKGKQKTEIQKLYDELELCGSRLMAVSYTHLWPLRLWLRWEQAI